MHDFLISMIYLSNLNDDNLIAPTIITIPTINADHMLKLLINTLTVVLVLALNNSSPLLAQQATSATGYATIENYYKVKWGFGDEFISLWKKNHYPLLRKAKEKGDIISIKAEKPVLHAGEDTRWDFKVTIVFKNIGLAFDPNLTTPYKAQLYLDQEKLKKDEQHRFELLLSHWDVLVEEVDPEN